MNNYINERSCCYKEIGKHLSGPSVQNQIYDSSIENRVKPDQAALTRAA